jgi:hypothetical protein
MTNEREIRTIRIAWLIERLEGLSKIIGKIYVERGKPADLGAVVVELDAIRETLSKIAM